MFEEVYFENDRMRIFADRYFDTLTQQRRFAARFKKQYDSKAPLNEGADAASLAGMNLEELKQYSALISDAIDALRDSRFVTGLARNLSQAVLNGASSVEELDLHLGDPTPVTP